MRNRLDEREFESGKVELQRFYCDGYLLRECIESEYNGFAKCKNGIRIKLS